MFMISLSLLVTRRHNKLLVLKLKCSATRSRYLELRGALALCPDPEDH